MNVSNLIASMGSWAVFLLVGAVLWTSGSTVTAPIHGTAVVVNGVLYVPSWDHDLHAFAL